MLAKKPTANQTGKYKIEQQVELQGRKRADIVLFNGEGKVVCVIEVKRAWVRGRCLADMSRIQKLVIQSTSKKNGSLGRGFLAVMLAKKPTANQTGKYKIEQQVERIKETIRDQFDCQGLTVRCHLGPVRHYPENFQIDFDEPQWAHAGFCVELSSPNARAG